MSEYTRETNEESFTEDVENATTPVLVDFYADWCAPCQAISPIVEDVSNRFGDRLDVVKVDVDQNHALATRFAVRSIPTLMLFKNGDPVETIVGLINGESLTEAIEQHI